MSEAKKYQGIELAREVAKAQLSDLIVARRNVQHRREGSQKTSQVTTDSRSTSGHSVDTEKKG